MGMFDGRTYQSSLGGGGGGGWSSALGGASSFLSGPWGMALAAFAPMLLSGMFQRRDPMQRAREQISSIMDPWNIRKQGMDEYRSNLQSPGYSQGRNEIIGGGQNALNLMNTSIAQRGLGRSGVGLAMPAAVQAGVGANLGRLNASAWDSAQNSARSMAIAKAQTLAGMPTAPNYGANLFAGGVNALMPLLMQRFGGQGADEEELLAMLRQLLNR